MNNWGTTMDREITPEDLTRANERIMVAERAAKAGSWDWDIRGGTYYWSPALFKLFDLDPSADRAGIEAWKSRIHPEDFEEASARIEQSVQDRVPLFTQYRIVLPDGEIRWIDAYGDTSYDDAGIPIRMAGFCIDATTRILQAQDQAALEHAVAELRAVEARLRESEQRLELALTASGLGLWDYHVPSGYVRYDARWCQIIGCLPSEIKPDIETWKQRVHPDDFTQTDAAANAHLRGETPTFQHEHRLRHKDGHWVWIFSSGRIVQRDASGNPLRLVGTVLDVSHQKRISQEGLGLLQRVETLLRDVAGANTKKVDKAEANTLEGLTRRQVQILTLVAKGGTSQQIAEQLHIAPSTVVSHRRDLMRRLNLRGTADVTRFAIEYGLTAE